MITLAQARGMVGQEVICRRLSGGDVRHGVITSVDDVFVYVRYAGEDRAKGTSPDLLGPPPDS